MSAVGSPVAAKSPTMQRPVILVTNDDGILATGLQRLAAALERVADVFVVAPERECSGSGRSRCLDRHLRPRRLGPNRWCLNGTPVDCVKAALQLALGRPDLLFSGINAGLNLGDDVTGSGTFGAAFEGALDGISSVAISQHAEADAGCAVAAEFALHLAASLLERPLPPRTLLNVNVPASAVLGVRVARLGGRQFDETVVTTASSEGRGLIRVRSRLPAAPDEEDTDIAAVEAGYIAITPLRVDLTDYWWMAAAGELARQLDARRERAPDDGRVAVEGERFSSG